jgi:hypothetical protein
MAKRKRRGTVACTTMATVSVDIWRVILGQTYRCPHLVFRLMMTCRTLRDAVHDDPAWWSVYYARVCAYQASRKPPPVLLFNTHGFFSPERILRAVFTLRCGMCGARRGHKLLRPFALRVCASCLRAHAISNQALDVYCGVRFCDVLLPYVASGGLLLSLDAFSAPGAALLRLSNSPCDARFVEEDSEGRRVHRVRKGTYFFMWCPDLERTLGVPLLSLVQAQLHRRHAAARLSACMQRLGARLWALGALRRVTGRDTPPRLSPHVQRKLCAVAVQTCAALRAEQPLAPAVQWFPGGLYHSAVSGRALYPPLETLQMKQALLRARSLPLGTQWFPQDQRYLCTGRPPPPTSLCRPAPPPPAAVVVRPPPPPPRPP